MNRVRIILGAVASGSIRGLILTDLEQEPVLTMDPPAGRVPVRAVALSDDAVRGIGGLRVFSFEAGGLRRGTEYRLLAACAGHEDVAFFTTLDPGAASLKVVVASCYYEGFNRASNYLDTLLSFHCRNADFKLLIGDNIYVDVHDRQRDGELDDGYTETGYIYRRYFWESEPYSQVWKTLPSFTTWDDHEFWNNFPEEQLWLKRTKPPRRDSYLRAGTEYLQCFQAILNPQGALSYEIRDPPVVSIFVADVRSQRRSMAQGGRMMPPATLQAIRRWAEELKRPGVLVLGQPLVIEEGGGTDYTPPNFPAEFQDLWRAVIAAPWEILVVSGDVHHSRALKLLAEGERRVFEVVTSPACHIPSITSMLFSYGSQDHGDVGFPLDLKPGGNKPRVASYYFGTEAPNSIATLTFTRASETSVDVGCAFLDLETGRPASSVNANDGFLRRGMPPEFKICEANHLFDLRQR